MDRIWTTTFNRILFLIYAVPLHSARMWMISPQTALQILQCGSLMPWLLLVIDRIVCWLIWRIKIQFNTGIAKTNLLKMVLELSWCQKVHNGQPCYCITLFMAITLGNGARNMSKECGCTIVWVGNNSSMNSDCYIKLLRFLMWTYHTFVELEVH